MECICYVIWLFLTLLFIVVLYKLMRSLIIGVYWAPLPIEFLNEFWSVHSPKHLSLWLNCCSSAIHSYEAMLPIVAVIHEILVRFHIFMRDNHQFAIKFSFVSPCEQGRCGAIINLRVQRGLSSWNLKLGIISVSSWLARCLNSCPVHNALKMFSNRLVD